VSRQFGALGLAPRGALFVSCPPWLLAGEPELLQWDQVHQAGCLEYHLKLQMWSEATL